ncbi:hypothetical protein CHUAL_002646 [Chamberlinius hualienensis]
MEILKSSLKSVLGTQQVDKQTDGADTVEKLVERVRTSMLLDDRRDAVRALKALARKFRLQVGAQGMDALITVLEMDRNVPEIVSLAVETLCIVVSPDFPDEEEENVSLSRSPDDLCTQFTEIFLKRLENISLLLSLLEEFEFSVRWPTVKLLTSLLINKPKDMQECILSSPMGVSRIMDLLLESREIIRNEALLLLAHLTKGNANLQKIVAFENAFERLLDIITEEGGSDGGIVVEDCLVLLLCLLKGNTSNQTFFKEGCFIQRLTPFFHINSSESEGDTGWSAQKVSNINYMLQIVRTLVSPSNPLQVTSTCQKVMNSCGLLEILCTILMASGVPADILAETINTVAEVIRGHHGNQEYFAAVTAPCNPPSPAIVVLVMSMVNDKQPFFLRCAALYCFQCFLYKNELGQAQIVQTLLPTSASDNTVTAGHLLCLGLINPSSLTNWFVSVALMHSLVDSSNQKEHLLRVQLVTPSGNTPIFLMQQITNMLMQNNKVQTRMGLLMLLSTWLANCPAAVAQFLNIPTNVPFLTSQVGLTEGDEIEVLTQCLCALVLGICVLFNDDSVQSFNKESLCQLIEKRVGIEAFCDKLGLISKHESYSPAAHKPQLKYHDPNEILFDYEFCKLIKSLEGQIIKVVSTRSHEALLNGPETNLTEAEHSLLQQYKGLIRDQDQQITDLKSKYEDLQVDHKKLTAQLKEMNESFQQLKDQNSLLKVQKSNSFNVPATEVINDDIAALKNQIQSLQLDVDEKSKVLKAKDDFIETMKSSATDLADDNVEINLLNEIVDEQKKEIESLKQENWQLKQLQTDTASQTQATDTNANNEELFSLRELLPKAEKKIKLLEEEKKSSESENMTLTNDLESLKKEQDDLLVLLTEQDSKLQKYRKRLQELGEPLNDEDDDIRDDLDDEDIEI